MTQPTQRGRMTQAAIDAAARTVIARKGILAATVAEIAAEAGKSTASFYNYYDSKEAMVLEWALRFRDEAAERAKAVTRHGLSDRERVNEAAAAHWHTYRHRLAEMISVSQLAMVNDDFAQYWSELCSIPIEFHHRHGHPRAVRRLLRRMTTRTCSPAHRGDAQPVLLPATVRQQRAGRRRHRRPGLHRHAVEHLLPRDLSARRRPDGHTRRSSASSSDWTPPASARAGAGGHPCQGLYHHARRPHSPRWP